MAPEVEAVDDQRWRRAAAAHRALADQDVGDPAVLVMGQPVAQKGHRPALGPVYAAKTVAAQPTVGGNTVFRPVQAFALPFLLQPVFGSAPLPPGFGEAETAIGHAHGHQAPVVGNQYIGPLLEPQARQAGHKPQHPRITPAVPPQAEPQSANGHQNETRNRQRRDRAYRSGPGGYSAGDPEQPVDPPAHHDQRHTVQAQRHQNGGDHCPGHDPQRRKRHRQHIGRQAEDRDPPEMMQSDQTGGEAGDNRRRGDPARIKPDARRDALAGGQPYGPKPVAEGLVEGNQSHDRRERHLETGPKHAFGRGYQDDNGGPGDEPHRYRLAVQQDGQQHQAGHDEGALGRHRRSGQQEIGETAGDGGDGGPFLDRVAQGEPLRKRQQCAQPEEQCGRHQPQM